MRTLLQDRGHAAHWLATNIKLSRDTLRKLTPAQGALGYLLWDEGTEHPEIIGVEGSHFGTDIDFTISASNYGALDISWHAMRIVALRAGRLHCRSKEFLPDESSALNIVWKILDSFDPVYLRHAIQSITTKSHGGALWILQTGQSTKGIQIGHTIERSNPPPREQHTLLFRWLNSVGGGCRPCTEFVIGRSS